MLRAAMLQSNIAGRSVEWIRCRLSRQNWPNARWTPSWRLEAPTSRRRQQLQRSRSFSLAVRTRSRKDWSPALTGALIDPTFSEGPAQLTQLQTGAREIGQQIHILNASTENEIDAAFASTSSVHIDALLIGATPFFRGRRNQIAELAARHGIPTSAEGRDFAEGGLLMSYGPSITDIYRQVGLYTGRILKGEKPADLPVVQPSKFELVINLKTAKTLSLSIPDKLLALADEVIE